MGLFCIWPRRRKPFPKAWEEILARRFAPYQRLPMDDLDRLRGLIRQFLAKKVFEGCNGQSISDEVRVSIAAYACLLLLHRPDSCYPQLGTVLVYPTSFSAPLKEIDQIGIVTETLEERLGESWQIGTIVLAWDSVCALCAGRGGGLNIILHEFAHQVDLEEGLSDGAPLKHRRNGRRNWDDLCRVEYARMRHARRRGHPQVLDPYGSASSAEFFAVATETFFERPVRLKSHHPELYVELQAIYGQDPAGCWG